MKNENKTTASSKKAKKTPYNVLIDKIIKAKQKKFGLKYDDNKSKEYMSYCLYSSAQIDTYGQYKHYASFYDYVILNKAELFKWYKFFFEVRTDCMFAQDQAPTKEGFVRSMPIKSSKWTNKELNELKRYVDEETLDSADAYYKLYKVKRADAEQKK